MDHSETLKTIDDFSIATVHTVSKGKGVVLWLHGITEGKDEYLRFFKDGAEYLGEKGIDSLRIDFRGHGESSGTSLELSIIGQMLDVECALDYLVRYYRTTSTQLHLVGCSFGAPPAIYAAIRHPEIIKSIVLICPVLSYRRTFLEPETEWANSIFNKRTLAKLKKTKKLFVNDDFPIGIRLVEEMRIIEPEVAIREVKQEIVLIHGDADSMVPFNVSKDIAKVVSKVQLIAISGMDHGFMDEGDEIGIDRKSIDNKKQIYSIIAERCA